MIIHLVGEDGYRIKERLDFLKAAFVKKYDPQGLNIESKEAAELSLDDFHRLSLSSGLLAKKRLLIIRNLEQTAKNILEEIKKTISQIPQEVILIFTSTKPLEIKADKMEKFPLFSFGQTKKWLEDKLKKEKVKMDNAAKEYLLEAVGSDLWQLASDLDKLGHYKKNLHLEDVQLFVKSPLEENIFKLTENLANRNLGQALKILDEQLALGINELQLLAMLSWQLKVLWQVKETNGQGLSLHPFVIQKALPQTRKFSLDKLKELFAELLKIDTQLKTTSIPAKVLLTLFLEKACLF